MAQTTAPSRSIPVVSNGLHYVDANMAVGADSNVIVLIWRGRTSMDAIRIVGDYHRQLTANRGRDFVLVTIVGANGRLPDAQHRKGIADLLRAGQQSMRASALVFEGSGFLAATIRGVVTGIALMARQSYPHRVFESVADAARFIEREQLLGSGMPITAQQVEQAVIRLRSQIAAKEQG